MKTRLILKTGQDCFEIPLLTHRDNGTCNLRIAKKWDLGLFKLLVSR